MNRKSERVSRVEKEEKKGDVLTNALLSQLIPKSVCVSAGEERPHLRDSSGPESMSVRVVIPDSPRLSEPSLDSNVMSVKFVMTLLNVVQIRPRHLWCP